VTPAGPAVHRAGIHRPGSRSAAARETACAALLAARRAGVTLRAAAAAAGVHVATVCRWQARDPALRDALRAAARVGWRVRHPDTPRRRPVPTHPLCPKCGACAVVRSAPRWRRRWRCCGRVRFWGCERWPRCDWASWRPRFPEDCPQCAGPLYWSDSRRSVGCDRCGLRVGGGMRIMAPCTRGVVRGDPGRRATRP
jgi:hypothetical protein